MVLSVRLPDLPDIVSGIHNRPIRYALMMQFVASIVGAQILINTVSYVQGTLNLDKAEYGWVMAAFEIGAILRMQNRIQPFPG